MGLKPYSFRQKTAGKSESNGWVSQGNTLTRELAVIRPSISTLPSANRLWNLVLQVKENVKSRIISMKWVYARFFYCLMLFWS